MPAAKYDQSDTAGVTYGHQSANISCSVSASNSQYCNLHNGIRWDSKHQSEAHVNYQASGVNTAVAQWQPLSGSAGFANLVCQQQEGMFRPCRQNEGGRLYSDDYCIEAETKNAVVNSQQALHSLSIEQDGNSEAFGLDQTQMSRTYQCYSLMEPPRNLQHIYRSNDSHGSPNVTCVEEALHLSGEARLPHNGSNMKRRCENTQKFGSEPVSQLNLALGHSSSQTAARQFPSVRLSDDLNSNEFSDKNNFFFLSVDQVTSDPICTGESSAQDINQIMEAKAVNTTSTFIQVAHENKLTEHMHCDELSRERLRCSISSDPEIYTKSPSVQKLNVKIQKLREEMLALRSTTDSYKQHMESMFDELKSIAQTHDENFSWTSSGNPHRTEDGPQRQKLISNISGQHSNTRSYGMDTDNLEAEESKSNKDFVRANESFVYPSYQPETSKSFAISQSNRNYENIFDVQQKTQVCSDSANNEVKRGRCNERPYSDPVSLCADQEDMIYSSSTEQKTAALSLPHPQSSNKHSAKTSKSSGNVVRRTMASQDHLHALPVLNKTNVALHISECSIDSGYQDSSLISPRERQSRDLASQVVTPASPIDESPFEATDQSTHDKLAPVSNCKESRYALNGLSDTPKAVSSDIIPIPNGFGNSVGMNADFTSKNIFHKNEEDIAVSFNSDGRAQTAVQKPKKIKLKSYDGPSYKLRDGERTKSNFLPTDRWSRSSSTSNESDELQQYVRPIPKQRTVFNPSKKITKSPCSDRSFNSPEVYFRDDTTTTSNKLKHSTPFETAALKQNNEEKKPSKKVSSKDQSSTSNASDVNSKPSRPTPPQGLALFKHSPHPSSDKGSPVQSTVKLGVSSIKLTPDNERNEGSLFYCTGQVSKSRTRKTANAKQLLREKFAAVVEHSVSDKNGSGRVNGDNESSVVRRRSMRMMTEFQIFDFKDKKTISSKPSRTTVDKSHRQAQDNSSKYVSSSISNNLSKSAPTSRNAVSTSVTTVTKEVFETGQKSKKMNKSTLHATKHCDKRVKQDSCELNSPNEPHNYERVYFSYTGEPLPPPPPSPPRSSPEVDGNPPDITNSHAQIFSKAEPILHGQVKHPDGVFLAPLIRPKASLSGVSCDVDPHDAPKTSYNGLKISPNAKSAFKPVLSASLQSLEHTGSSLTEDFFEDEITSDFKRRSSLPSAMVSNKQRFLKEFVPNNLHHEQPSHSDSSNVEDDNKTIFCRQSSVRVSKKSNATVTSTKSEEKVVERSHNAIQNKPTEASIARRQQPFATTEPLFSELPKKTSTKHKKEPKKRLPTSDDKKNSSSSKDQQDLECQPVRFDRNDAITNVVGALKTAGYLRQSTRDQSSQKVCGNSTSSHGARPTNENSVITSQSQQQASRPVRSQKFDNPSVIQNKPLSLDLVHQYEVIQPIGNKKSNKKDPGRNQVVRQQTFSDSFYLEDGVFEPSPTKSHKSTVAMIRDGLLRKRDKTSRNAGNEKRKEVCNDVKSRSSSVGARRKDKIEQPFREPNSSTSKSKVKDSKSKKNKSDSKQQKDKSSSTNKTSKDQSHKAGSSSRNVGYFSPEIRPPSPVLPDAGPRRYGDPDSEVMERFLAAAAASHTNKTPLQRLRSSLRVPKNKNKFLSTSRIKDDIDVGKNPHSIHLGSQFDKNFPHGDEFTYV